MRLHPASLLILLQHSACRIAPRIATQHSKHPFHSQHQHAGPWQSDKPVDLITSASRLRSPHGIGYHTHRPTTQRRSSWPSTF